MRSTVRTGVMAAAVTAAVLSLVATPASADPAYAPDANDFVGVGSDTSQYVIDAAADAFPAGIVTTPAYNAARRVASYDATGSATITIRPGVTINRPNGSSQGISALAATGSQVDYARSSRGASGTEGTTLYFRKTLKDGLSYVYNKSAAGVHIKNLNAAELKNIYTCVDTSVKPVLPQSGSGTRSFFLSSIGLTEADVAGKPCITVAQEHDPAPVAADALKIAPFSTARYAVNPVGAAPSTLVTIATTVPSTSRFFAERDIYNVVRKADYDSATQGNDFKAVFGPTGYFCKYYAANVANRQGFGFDAATCGTA